MPIIGTFITAHAPGITGYPQAAGDQERTNTLAALEELGRRVKALKPDLIVGISNDHFTAFFDPMPPFCIGLAPEFQGPNPDFERMVGLACKEYSGHSEYANALLQRAYEAHFDLTFSRAKLMFEDQFPVPLHFLDPDGEIPIVPIYVNCNLEPLPSIRRCFELGSVISHVAAQRPEKVLLLASGGLSHWVGTLEEGQINDEFESRVLNALRAGKSAELLELTHAEIDAAGNGAHEIRNWLVAFGANAPGCKLEVLAHERVPQWQSGIVIGTILDNVA